MSADSLAMMPWFPRDFIAATRAMRIAERCAYRELLDFQWELGVLPNDVARLARLIGFTDAEFADAWPGIKHKFVERAGGLVNKRLEEHRVRALEQREKKRRAADSTNAKRNAKRGGERTQQSEILRDASDTPPSPSPSPSMKENTNGRTSFDRFWEAYPKKVKRKDAEKIWREKKLEAKAETIIADVHRRPSSERWRNGYIPDPPVYLRGERWDDAFEEGVTPRIAGI